MNYLCLVIVGELFSDAARVRVHQVGQTKAVTRDNLRLCTAGTVQAANTYKQHETKANLMLLFHPVLAHVKFKFVLFLLSFALALLIARARAAMCWGMRHGHVRSSVSSKTPSTD